MTETVDLSRPISELPRALALLQVMKGMAIACDLHAPLPVISYSRSAAPQHRPLVWF